MRLRIRSDEIGHGSVAIRNASGVAVGALWSATIRGLATLRVLALKELPLPVAGDQPVPGLIASAVAAARQHQALVLLDRPAQALGPARMAYADGVRLIAIAEPADESCWDAALGLGLPLWGVRGTLVFDLDQPPERCAQGALSALTYGLFHCADGHELASLDEDRSGVAWTSHDGAGPAVSTVIIRGGFEAGSLPGSGRYDDRGHEGTVRLVVRSAAGAAFTQPRFIAGRRPAMPANPATKPSHGC
ncbi:hypothetical protein LBMAG53_15820 [Planctomycetota bacterium]|nr:hypothetical protein LBMAG53_15820 [Planctomycetota bacterium]